MEALLSYGFRDQLARIEVPTLVVWGRNDMLVPRGDAREYVRLIGDNARREMFEDTGHLSMVERPSRFNRLLAAFVAGEREPEAGVEGVSARRVEPGAEQQRPVERPVLVVGERVGAVRGAAGDAAREHERGRGAAVGREVDQVGGVDTAASARGGSPRSRSKRRRDRLREQQQDVGRQGAPVVRERVAPELSRPNQ